MNVRRAVRKDAEKYEMDLDRPICQKQGLVIQFCTNATQLAGARMPRGVGRPL